MEYCMNARNGIMLGTLLVTGVTLSLFLFFLLRTDAAGNGFVAIRPTVPALYTDNNREALDDELLYGMAGEVVEKPDTNDRYLVKTRYNLLLRVDKKDLRLDPGVSFWEPAAKYCVIAPFADVLPSPDVKAYPPLLTLPRGALLCVTGGELEYFEVGLADGSHGYVRRTALREIGTWNQTGEEETRRQLAEDARSYLGTPYRWGGKSPFGIDCSGLASMVYMLNSLFIYRNSRPAPGFPIALLSPQPPFPGKFTAATLATAKPGDLIYWEGHQAVYLGEGKFIHANATSNNVRINSLIEGDNDYLPELGNPANVLAWGTAFPKEPDRLIVKGLRALPGEAPRTYRFQARVDGYTPTAAILYPEGAGEGKPSLDVDPGCLLYGGLLSEQFKPPEYRYSAPGTYYPAVEFRNQTGWLPGGAPLASGVFVMKEPVVVK